MAMGEWGVDTQKFKSGLRPYLDQLLLTATKGNVSAKYAVYVSRMQLTCKVCEAQLTVVEPPGQVTSTDLDYGTQEFIKIHAHTGGHNDEKNYPFKPLSPAAKKILEGIDLKNVSNDLIQNPDELKIKAKMDEYTAETVKKEKNEALAKKIKQLQSQTEQDIKVQELAVAGWSSFKNKGLTTQEEFESHKQVLQQMKEEEQMLANVLAIMEIQAKNAALKGAISGHHVTPEKREKPLRVATGRKFR